MHGQKSKVEVKVEALNLGFMASIEGIRTVGVGETEEQALERLFEKLPKFEEKNAKT